MNLITAIKARLLHLAEEDEILVKKKKQFNVKIEEEVIDQVRYLASRYGAPLTPTAAHMLQVGAYCVLMRCFIMNTSGEFLSGIT